MLGALLISFFCNCKQKTTNNLLAGENIIINNYLDKILTTKNMITDAKKNNQQKLSLDLERNLEKEINELNEELSAYAEIFPDGREVPFEVRANESFYSVKNVVVLGCRFNEEEMQVETLLRAKVQNMNDTNTMVSAFLVDDGSKKMSEIKFVYTNVLPEKQQITFIYAHPGNFQKIKEFQKIFFQ